MKKKWLLLTCLSMLFLQQLTFADYITLYEWRSEPEIIADGVTSQHIQRFTNGGWLNMNLVNVDLAAGAEMTVVTDDYLSERDTLSKLVAQSEEASEIVAAINSDFFDTANNTTMGTLIKDGEVLSTSVGYNEFASFNIAKNGLPFVGYINTPNNTFSNGKTTMKISYINKPYLNYDRTILFDNNWSTVSYGNTIGQDIAEMLVVNDVVKEMRLNGPAFTIPENGYVLASVGTDISQLLNSFKIGDTITIHYDVNFNAIDLTIGGGAQILTNGAIPTTFSQNISGNNPRTALGIDRDRKKLILLTIDGRTTSYRGVTQTELAQLLLEFGAYEGINLDGGGSTEMLVKTPWDTSAKIVNRPSDGAERKMYTGLVVVKDTVANPALKQVKIDMASDAVLLGEKLTLSLMGIDENYDMTAIDPADVKWSVSGVAGSLEGDRFAPTATGVASIQAAYKGLTAQKTVHVYDNGVKIVVEPSVLKLDAGQQKQMQFYIQTAEGQKVATSPEALTLVLPDNLGAFDMAESTFTAGADGQQGYMTVGFNDLITYVPIGNGTDKALIADFETETGTFLSYPEAVTGKYAELNFPKTGAQGGMLTYDFTTTTETRAAYMKFNAPIMLPGNTESIGLWAYGDYGNDHWLRGKIVDANGAATNITFARHIDWTGWKYLTAELPDELAAPFTLERIYVVETDVTKQDSGTVVIDDVYAVVGQTITEAIPENVTKQKQIADYKIEEGLTRAFTAAYLTEATEPVVDLATASGIVKAAGSGFSAEVKNGIWVMTLNNSGGSIRANDYTQWTKFIQQVTQITSRPVVLMMRDTETFNDSLEGTLLYRQLGTLVDKGLDVTVLYPTNGDYSVNIKSGIRILNLPKSIEQLKAYTFAVRDKALAFEIVQ
jgi:exopolysaccharide biosynthesis protein